jgi:hypothetical protein
MIEGSGRLQIHQTGTESLSVEAESNLLPRLQARVDGGRLMLRPEPGARLAPTQPIIYILTVKNLDTFTISGEGSVDAADLAGERLDVNLSGAGSMKASGSVGRQDVRVSGSASYHTDALRSQDVTISVSGTGGAIVHAEGTLEASISGSGSVVYVGNPAVTKQIAGSGSIRQQ